MNISKRVTEFSSREEETLDLLRKGGFRVLDGATKELFNGFPVGDPVFNSHLMNLVVALILARNIYLTDGVGMDQAREKIEEYRKALVRSGANERRVIDLMHQVGDLTPEEALLRGEKGRPK